MRFNWIAPDRGYECRTAGDVAGRSNRMAATAVSRACARTTVELRGGNAHETVRIEHHHAVEKARGHDEAPWPEARRGLSVVTWKRTSAVWPTCMGAFGALACEAPGPGSSADTVPRKVTAR